MPLVTASPSSPQSAALPDELLTGPQAQRFAKVTKQTLRKWRERGLRAYGTGKQLRYTRADLLAHIERKSPAPDQGSSIVK